MVTEDGKDSGCPCRMTGGVLDAVVLPELQMACILCHV